MVWLGVHAVCAQGISITPTGRISLRGREFKAAEIEKEETLIVPVELERRNSNRSSEQRRENRQGVNNTWPSELAIRFYDTLPLIIDGNR